MTPSELEGQLLDLLHEFVTENRAEQRRRGIRDRVLIGVLIVGALFAGANLAQSRDNGRSTHAVKKFATNAEMAAKDARSASRAAERGANQLADVLSPGTCFGTLSRYTSDLRTWDIKRSITQLAKFPDPHRPDPPPKLLTPDCRALYDSFEPNLPR